MNVKQEDFQNRALAMLLREQGLDADYEQRAGRKRMDIVAHVSGLRIVLEAETGFQRKAQAIKDADARLHQGLTVAVFAVCYPDGVNEENLATSLLTWTLRTKPGEPSGQWTTGTVSTLARAVQQTPSSLSGADVAAQKLSDGLDEVVQQLNPIDHRNLAETLDLPANKPGNGGKKSIDPGYSVAAKRGLLVVATAMLFHHRLQGHLPFSRPVQYAGEWPPASPGACTDREAVLSAFQEAWRAILAVDYRPVFQTGIAALGALSANPGNSLAIRKLGRLIAQIAEDVAALRHDLLGRIFHRVLDTARYDGSYYTSTAAAVLLTTLAIRQQDIDWTDPNAVTSLRICDPACGTGTLLMAAAERIRDLRNAGGRGETTDEEALSLRLVEDVLWGYDCNLTATHMAATTLGMLSPATQFGRMNIHRVRLGVIDGVAYLGSLEFLTGQARLETWPGIAERVEDNEAAPMPPPLDLVIMNPPYTRDSLRYDQFSTGEELAIKRRELELFADRPVHLSGGSGAFLVLAEQMSKAETGGIAVVLPLVGITDKSGFELRKQLGSRYHVETIVSSHDPDRINFSENTTIGEVLIVCRRWHGRGEKPPTYVFNLARNPTTPLEALDTASRIERARRGDTLAPTNFTFQEVSPLRIADGDWSAVNFLSPFLTSAYRRLREDNVASIPFVEVNTLAHIGPEGRRIRDAYTRQRMQTALGRRALWYHKTEVTQAMAAKPDVYIEPKADKLNLADNYWAQRSNMLLPSQLWLPLARVASVMLPEPVVSSRWIPCRPHEPSIAKALCLYLNSTVGLLGILGDRDNRKPSYPSFSLDTLRSMPVPELTTLGSMEMEKLTQLFDRLRHKTLQPFPLLEDDEVRLQIDHAVIQALKLDPEWVATIRRELALEPSITNKARF